MASLGNEYCTRTYFPGRSPLATLCLTSILHEEELVAQASVDFLAQDVSRSTEIRLGEQRTDTNCIRRGRSAGERTTLGSKCTMDDWHLAELINTRDLKKSLSFCAFIVDALRVLALTFAAALTSSQADAAPLADYHAESGLLREAERR